jgi:hypothetical protein
LRVYNRPVDELAKQDLIHLGKCLNSTMKFQTLL